MTLHLSTSRVIGMAAALTLSVATGAAAQQSTGSSRDTTMRDSARAGMRGTTSSSRVRVQKDQPTTGGYGTTAPTTGGTTTGGTMSGGTMSGGTTSGGTTTGGTTSGSATTGGTMSGTTTGTTTGGTTTTGTTTTGTGTTGDIPGMGAPMRRLGNGFYVGLAAGPAVPVGQSSDLYQQGYAVSVPLGWDGAGPLGVRADLGYSRLGGRTLGSGTTTYTFADQDILSGMLDAKLRLPLGTASSPVSFYALGGGGVHHFRRFRNPGLFTSNGTLGGGTTTTSPTAPSVTELGLNAGAGFSFNVAGTSLFLESRYVSVFTEGTRTNMLPIVLGVTF